MIWESPIESTSLHPALGRIGQCVFWLLVIIIVSTRVLFYPAAPAFEAGGASDAKHAATR
jgi:hypothetical protein